MIARIPSWRLPRFALAISLITATTVAQAHLMAEQHGTLNFANGGAYLVLSIPVSAFEGVDDDDDQAMSTTELSRYTAYMEEQIHSHVQLLNHAGEPVPLQGLMLSLSPPDHAPGAPAKQIVALGRFAVDQEDSQLVLQLQLMGESPEEQKFRVTATRNNRSQVLEFVPGSESQALFPSAKAQNTEQE